jgi:hypothetical protein
MIPQAVPVRCEPAGFSGRQNENTPVLAEPGCLQGRSSRIWRELEEKRRVSSGHR